MPVVPYSFRQEDQIDESLKPDQRHLLMAAAILSSSLTQTTKPNPKEQDKQGQ